MPRLPAPKKKRVRCVSPVDDVIMMSPSRSIRLNHCCVCDGCSPCSRFEAAREDDDSPPPPPTSLTADIAGMEQSEIQELLASTMKQIEERKKHTQNLLVGC